MTAEPGVIPEEKREQDQQQSEQRDEEVRFGSGAFGTGGHERVIIALQWPALLEWPALLVAGAIESSKLEGWVT